MKRIKVAISKLKAPKENYSREQYKEILNDYHTNVKRYRRY